MKTTVLLSTAALLCASILPTQNMQSAEGSTLPAGTQRVPAQISGGHETDPRDHGRPVILVAAGLGVTPEVFREAFSRVRPAGPGQRPEEGQVRQNKAALMNALGKHGVTNERLDEVSNFYRYPPGRGGLWKVREAKVNGLVRNGQVIGYEVVDGGYGYSSTPEVTVPGATGEAAVEIAYGKDLQTNGAIAKVTPAKR